MSRLTNQEPQTFAVKGNELKKTNLNETLTRTIKKINLSHFLHNRSCFLESSLLRTKPTAQLLVIKPVQGDSILIHHQHCTATLKEAS